MHYHPYLPKENLSQLHCTCNRSFETFFCEHETVVLMHVKHTGQRTFTLVDICYVLI